MKVKIVQPVLQGNDRIASELRDIFTSKRIFVFNVISSPGSGKTSFLEGVIALLHRTVRIGVIVGDIEDTVDAQRLSKHGVNAVQLNTKGACHLDAGMVRTALKDINADEIDLLIIENVGNLVCPGEFDLGEDIKVVILSSAEGDDKPKKYPLSFFKADAVVINKTDLIPYTNFSLEKAKADILAINPGVRIFETTATKHETLHEFTSFLDEKIRWKKNAGR